MLWLQDLGVNLATSLASSWCKSYLMFVSFCFLFWGIFVEINWNDICKAVDCLGGIMYLILVYHLCLHLPSLPPRLLSAITKCSGQLLVVPPKPSQHLALLTIHPFWSLSSAVLHKASFSCFLLTYSSVLGWCSFLHQLPKSWKAGVLQCLSSPSYFIPSFLVS